MWSTSASGWDEGPRRRRILGRMRRPSGSRGLGVEPMTFAVLEALGERHQSPRGPGKRWRRSALRTRGGGAGEEHDEEALDFEVAIASW
ncbi:MULTISPECIES: hypothetical protein [unclassified Myxococcus]|uniref:hypothetical protein n=1 Tax=unclassified Myxococcus TaxID=2648731 RepID=UPI00157A3AA5|nr:MULTISPECIES: hypothetical protein [unclassified Myxococcus]NTX35032.1 hypothetical protein [Myxococcus sp. CA033]NTX51499.1 hypothetical protein [Myxococcus sp. CA039A]